MRDSTDQTRHQLGIAQCGDRRPGIVLYKDDGTLFGQRTSRLLYVPLQISPAAAPGVRLALTKRVAIFFIFFVHQLLPGIYSPNWVGKSVSNRGIYFFHFCGDTLSVDFVLCIFCFFF